MTNNKVLDFNKKREENIEAKRRNFERLLFRDFLGAYSVIDESETLYPIELVDISKKGCLFQVPWNDATDKEFAKGTEIKMRMYFTKQTFIPVLIKVKYGKKFVGDNGQAFMQYGGEFDSSMPSFTALQSFIDFMYKFAEHSTFDKEHSTVFFL
jgi:hypothetical protein